ncbi:MAG TPA: BamA/TamA family outer membrane protein [Cyclobacteriaceae bacterium]
MARIIFLVSLLPTLNSSMILKIIRLFFLLLLFPLAGVNGQQGQGQKLPQVEKKQKPRVAAIPMINYNRTQGIVVGALASGFYKINKKDTISPSSNTGVMGMYTQQKSYMLIGFSRFYFAQDRWRVTAAIGTMDINFQFYLEDPALAGGNFYDYATKANLAVFQVQRNIFKRIYLGPTGSLIQTTTTFGLPGASGEDSVKISNMNNLGYVLSNDTRDHVQYPTRGMFVNFKNQFYGQAVGSDYKFQKYMVTFNQFFKLTKKDESKILAVRASFNIAAGNVPFEGQSVVGSDDIRGYSQGRYRNNQVYAVQTEYRWNFYKRFGLVAFAGVASAVAKISDIPNNDILLGAGGGLRFRMLPSEKINIGIDYGKGKDDYSITFRIGESFGR